MENQVHTVLHRKFMLIFYRKRYISTVAFGRLCWHRERLYQEIMRCGSRVKMYWIREQHFYSRRRPEHSRYHLQLRVQIGVGAYDALTFSYADFSGRGQRGAGRLSKPDIVAPGVNVTAPTTSGTYASFSGTSFATPFVTGGAALMMEWGIIKENDPYLYGEKVKAYMQRGARPLLDSQSIRIRRWDMEHCA